MRDDGAPDQSGLCSVMFGPEFARVDQDLRETTLTTPLSTVKDSAATMNTAERKIFPLPLTPFEIYFYWDGTPEFPMFLEGAVHLTGQLHPARFEQAIRSSLKQHPLFSAQVQKQGKDLYWVESETGPTIEWLQAPLDLNTHDWGMPGDLLQGNQFRICVYSHAESTIVYYHCHHIYTDQAGMCQFLNDVFAHYATLQGEVISASVPVNPDRIRDRASIIPLELPIGTLQIIWETIKAAAVWMVERPVPLEARQTPGATRRFGKKTYRVPPELTKQIKTDSKSKGCTVNDLLLSIFYPILAAWQMEQNKKTKRKHLRINIPVNMRWKGSEDVPASNIVSYTFLTRQISSCLGNLNLLPGIHKEMKIIKEMQVGFIMLDTLKFFHRIPGGIRSMTRKKSCLASIVFSNMGVLGKYFTHGFSRTEEGRIRFGGLILDAMEWYVPCRNKTYLTLAVSHQADELLISCQYDNQHLSEKDVDRFFHEFMNALNGTCPRH